MTLTVEHRAAPSPKPITIELAQRGLSLALEVAEAREPASPVPATLDDRIIAVLAEADRPLMFADVRGQCRVRTATLYERLAVLLAAGRITKDGDSYRAAGD